ncbi:hypothetical protein [Microbacterium terregens]|uniref:Lipoprotein LpqH n=1 Tax=Microbacterium terregens TaxID=69363 RepID=A0ABV5T1A8_9MICO
MRAPRHTIPSLGAVALLILALSGCAGAGANTGAPSSAGEPSDPPRNVDAAQSPTARNGEATFSAGGRDFTIDLAVCSVYEAGDVLLGGPANEVGTDATGYLDGDSTVLDSQAYGEFRIDIGADGPLQSTDDFLALGNSLGGAFALSDDGAGYLITASAWNAQGDDLGEATLAFTCS